MDPGGAADLEYDLYGSRLDLSEYSMRPPAEHKLGRAANISYLRQPLASATANPAAGSTHHQPTQQDLVAKRLRGGDISGCEKISATVEDFSVWRRGPARCRREHGLAA